MSISASAQHGSLTQLGRWMSLNATEQRRPSAGRDMWMRGIYSDGTYGSDGNSGGFRFSGGGIVAGLDHRIAQGSTVGLFAGITDSRTTLENSAGKIDSGGVRVGGQWRKVVGDVDWSVIGSVGLFNNDAERNITLPGINRKATAKYRVYDISIDGSVAKTIAKVAHMDVKPEMRLGLFSTTSEAYRESGAGALDLAVGRSESLTGKVSLGGTLVSDPVSFEALRLSVSAFFNHNRKISGDGSQQGFVGAAQFQADAGRRKDSNFTLGFAVGAGSSTSSWSIEAQHIQGPRERGTQLVGEYRLAWY